MTGPERIDTSDVLARIEQIREIQPDLQVSDPVRVVSAADDQSAAKAMREHRLNAWRQVVPRIFQPARLDDLTEWAGHADIAAWSADDERPNLVILGPVGVGKTHAATAAVRHAFGTGSSLVWLPVSELLDRLDWRRPDSHEHLDAVMACDLLVLDDLGTERSNEWTGERVYTVLNRRHIDGRPTVATTNLEPAELAEALGERTYSRLVGGALVLRMAGHDRRRNQ